MPRLNERQTMLFTLVRSARLQELGRDVAGEGGIVGILDRVPSPVALDDRRASHNQALPLIEAGHDFGVERRAGPEADVWLGDNDDRANRESKVDHAVAKRQDANAQ